MHTLYVFLVKFSSVAVSKAGWPDGLVRASRAEVSEFVAASSNLCSGEATVFLFPFI